MGWKAKWSKKERLRNVLPRMLDHGIRSIVPGTPGTACELDRQDKTMSDQDDHRCLTTDINVKYNNLDPISTASVSFLGRSELLP